MDKISLAKRHLRFNTIKEKNVDGESTGHSFFIHFLNDFILIFSISFHMKI